ncbi:MAG: type II secretion system F family protein [Anaerolineae bacterium]
MNETQIIIVIAAAAIAAIVVGIGIFSARSEQNLLEERLGRYEQENYQSFLEPSEGEQEKEEKPSAIANAVEGIIMNRSFGQKWRRQLARADIKLTVAEYAALHILAMIGFFAAAYFVIFSGQMVMSILAAFIGFFAPRIWVSRATSTRLIKFEEQLPDTLSLWVNALRSGYSVLQSMEAIARDSPEPTATEFKRVVQEVQLGIDMDDALEHLLNRVESEDLDLVVTAVNIQREVGGNLAEILEVIGTTIRERIKLKGEIRVLTSQGRITGYLLSFLPIGLALFLNAANPGYMGQMFENRLCGWPMLGAGLALIGIGTAVIQKIIDIEM